MRYRNVQALRAIAASLVVIGHAANGLIMVPPYLATLGYSGVDVFFVISGFIICTISRRPDKPQTTALENAFRFLVRRYWRIFPLYWTVLAVAAALTMLGVEISPSWMGIEPAWHYVLLWTMSNYFVPPAWTLAFELYFYTSFALILLFMPRHMFTGVMVLMAVQIILSVTHANAEVAGSPLVLEFGLGCLVSWLDLRGERRWSFAALAGGIVLFGIGGIFAHGVNGPSAFQRLVTFGVAGAGFLYFLINVELAKKWIAPRWLQKLGDASYSLYLWHFPLVALALKIGAGSLAVPMIFGIALWSWRYLEKPLLSIDVLGALRTKYSASLGSSIYRDRLISLLVLNGVRARLWADRRDCTSGSETSVTADTVPAAIAARRGPAATKEKPSSGGQC